MSVVLTDVRESVESETLAVVESVEHASKRLAVCKTSTGELVLARERERPVADGDGKRPKQDSNGKPRKREPYWKRTASLADFRDSIASGLIAA